MATWGSLLRRAAQAGIELLTRPGQEQERRRPERPARPRPPIGGARTVPTRDRARRIAYAPDLDGAADPGEIVWTWVPFEEDDGRGKDRPVLVVGREGPELVGLMLSSRADRADDRDWVGVGTGAWDDRGRPSYVRLDRVIEVGEQEIRREGAVLDRARFDRVADALRAHHGWT